MGDISDRIDRAHEEQGEEPRSHFGCSSAGHKCERWLWLQFRWAVIEDAGLMAYKRSIVSKDPKIRSRGQLLRLFRRGHHEENWIIDDLRAIGATVADEQKRVDFGSHVSGSIDGTVSNIPGHSGLTALLECKSHNEKSFDELEKHGVEESKPVHDAQMQLYMLGLGLEKALYFPTCKNDDRTGEEFVELDRGRAEWLRDRAIRIALSERMPEPLSTDSTWYECKMCRGHRFCFDEKITREVNCRTCAHSTPTEASEWTCARWGKVVIPVDAQRKGCDCHVLHPDLVPWKMKRVGEFWHCGYGEWINGNPDDLPGSRLSSDLIQISLKGK